MTLTLLYKNIIILEGNDFTPGTVNSTTNDPPTCKGIIQPEYNTYRLDNGYPTQSVKFITDYEAEAIYLKNYYYKHGIDFLPDLLDFTVFQGIVNETGLAIPWLQKVAGVKQDGLLGPVTLSAVQKMPLTKSILGFLQAQDAHYSWLEGQGKDPDFIKGLHNRVKYTAEIVGIPYAS